jgi:hypothetical protein
VYGAEFMVQGAGCRVQGSGVRVQGSVVRVQGSGFRVQGPGFMVTALPLYACAAVVPQSLSRETLAATAAAASDACLPVAYPPTIATTVPD